MIADEGRRNGRIRRTEGRAGRFVPPAASVRLSECQMLMLTLPPAIIHRPGWRTPPMS